MNIIATYTPTAKELAKASSLFIEKKTFLKICVYILNIFALMLLITLAMQPLTEFTPQKISALVVALVWILGRRPFNEWLLYKKMQGSNVLGKEISITFSRNGIAWSGDALQNGNMSWVYIKYILMAKNGFIIPQSATKFLWIPFRAFSDNHAVDELKAFIKEKKIKLREYPRWIC